MKLELQSSKGKKSVFALHFVRKKKIEDQPPASPLVGIELNPGPSSHTTASGPAASLFNDGLLLIHSYLNDREWIMSSRVCHHWFKLASRTSVVKRPFHHIDTVSRLIVPQTLTIKVTRFFTSLFVARSSSSSSSITIPPSFDIQSPWCLIRFLVRLTITEMDVNQFEAYLHLFPPSLTSLTINQLVIDNGCSITTTTTTAVAAEAEAAAAAAAVATQADSSTPLSRIQLPSSSSSSSSSISSSLQSLNINMTTLSKGKKLFRSEFRHIQRVLACVSQLTKLQSLNLILPPTGGCLTPSGIGNWYVLYTLCRLEYLSIRPRSSYPMALNKIFQGLTNLNQTQLRELRFEFDCDDQTDQTTNSLAEIYSFMIHPSLIAYHCGLRHLTFTGAFLPDTTVIKIIQFMPQLEYLEATHIHLLQAIDQLQQKKKKKEAIDQNSDVEAAAAHSLPPPPPPPPPSLLLFPRMHTCIGVVFNSRWCRCTITLNEQLNQLCSLFSPAHLCNLIIVDTNTELDHDAWEQIYAQYPLLKQSKDTTAISPLVSSTPLSPRLVGIELNPGPTLDTTTADSGAAGSLFNDGLFLIYSYLHDRDWIHSACVSRHWFTVASRTHIKNRSIQYKVGDVASLAPISTQTKFVRFFSSVFTKEKVKSTSPWSLAHYVQQVTISDIDANQLSAFCSPFYSMKTLTIEYLRSGFDSTASIRLSSALRFLSIGFGISRSNKITWDQHIQTIILSISYLHDLQHLRLTLPRIENEHMSKLEWQVLCPLIHLETLEVQLQINAESVRREFMFGVGQVSSASLRSLTLDLGRFIAYPQHFIPFINHRALRRLVLVESVLAGDALIIIGKSMQLEYFECGHADLATAMRRWRQDSSSSSSPCLPLFPHLHAFIGVSAFRQREPQSQQQLGHVLAAERLDAVCSAFSPLHLHTLGIASSGHLSNWNHVCQSYPLLTSLAFSTDLDSNTQIPLEGHQLEAESSVQLIQQIHTFILDVRSCKLLAVRSRLLSLLFLLERFRALSTLVIRLPTSSAYSSKIIGTLKRLLRDDTTLLPRLNTIQLESSQQQQEATTEVNLQRDREKFVQETA